MNEKEYVDEIRRENQVKYGGNQETRQMLEALVARTFPTPWLFLFELTQNAIDAGAEHIRLTAGVDNLLFEHDGKMPFTKEHVRALSKLGMSAKKVNAIGFMGVGFKSVFQRFRKAQIACHEWRFRFHIRVQLGPRGAEMPNWLDTVLPEWDESAPVPDAPFTTAFRLSEPFHSNQPIEDHLPQLLDARKPITLAVLAVHGLRQFTLNDQTWILNHDIRQREVRVTSKERTFRWCAILRDYTPSEHAIRRLVEFRRQLVQDAEDEEALEHRRRVLALVPLTSDGVPEPPARGRVYATLPTSETLPFGMHLQADWLLDITRRGLVSVQDDPWQDQIVQQLPALLAEYLGWLTGSPRSRAALVEGFRVLGVPPKENANELDAAIDDEKFRPEFTKTLRDLRFLPRLGGPEGGLLAPDEAIFLPGQLAATFGAHPEWHTETLFGGATVDMRATGERVGKFLKWLGVLRTVDHRKLARDWPAAVERWWTTLAMETAGRRRALFALWGGLADLVGSEPAWSALPCVPTSDGTWKRVSEVQYLDQELPAETAPGGARVREWIKPFLPPNDRQIPIDVVRALRASTSSEPEGEKGQRTAAQTWLLRNATEVKLDSVIQRATTVLLQAGHASWENLIYLAEWARYQKQSGLIEYLVVATASGAHSIVRCSEALVAEPYVGSGAARCALFPLQKAITDYYLASTGTNSAEWRSFFEERGAGGALRLRERRRQLGRHEKDQVAAEIGVRVTEVVAANNNGYTVVDYDLPVPWPPSAIEALASWLEVEHAALRGYGKKRVQSFFQETRRISGTEPCAWVLKLEQTRWVPTKQGRLLRPAECLVEDSDDYEDAPVASLSVALVRTLHAEGVRFGINVPRSAAVRRLALRSGQRSASELAALLGEAVAEIADDEAGWEQLRSTLAELMLPAKDGPVTLARVVKRTGGGADSRSGFGGFVASLGDLAPELAAALVNCKIDPLSETTTGEHAMSYLETVWSEAQRDPARPAEGLRQHLRLAYTYVLEDLSTSTKLRMRWEKSRANAMVHGRGGWRAASTKPFVDDLADARIRLHVPAGTVTATAGHLGETSKQIQQAARALGLPLLSEKLAPKWEKGPTLTNEPWAARFRVLKSLLDRLPSRAGEGVADVELVKQLVLRIGERTFDVNARILDRVLVVAGTPDDFMDEAAAELVEAYTLGQRGPAVASLAGALLNLRDSARFRTKLERLADILELKIDGLLDHHDVPPAHPTEGNGSDPTDVRGPTRPATSSPSETTGEGSKTSQESAGPHVKTEAPFVPRGGSDGDRSESKGSDASHSKPKGGAVPPKGPDMRRLVAVQSSGVSGQHTWPSDERGRKAVMAHEHRHHRTPEEKPFNNEGYDILSHDPVSGKTRRIEIKGTAGIWRGDASVIMSSRQFHDPDRVPDTEEDVEHWLYVVDSRNVIAIPWYKIGVGGYVFYAEDWEPLAVEREAIAEDY